MFHDLRSRGTGIASYKGVGTGNDFDGWEFHRATQVQAVEARACKPALGHWGSIDCKLHCAARAALRCRTPCR